MGKITEISWADSTFNPWIGCMKVSRGCDNCYAEGLMADRYKRVEWGQRKVDGVEPSVGTRSRTSPANWHQPVVWNRHHDRFLAMTGRRRRVFCSSLADVFDNQVPPEWRADLFDLIRATPKLDWLLLTKRPQNILKMLPPAPADDWPWPNVWFGTTAEDQAAFDERWPLLEQVPAWVRFISYEPALGPLTMTGHEKKPDWLICGGESGQGHRSMQASWAYRAMDECAAAAIPFFMKQMSGTKPAKVPIPDDLLVRQFPSTGRVAA